MDTPWRPHGDPEKKKSKGDLCVMTQRIWKNVFIVSGKGRAASNTSFGNLLKDSVVLLKIIEKPIN